MTSAMDPTSVARTGPSGGTVQPASDPDPIELPPEVWTEIFKPLSMRQLLRVRLVCRRWKDIVDGSSILRRKISVTFKNKMPTEPGHLPPASRVHMMELEPVVVGSWWSLLGKSLTEIDMFYCTIDMADLLELLKQAPNLKRLELNTVEVFGKLTAPEDFRLHQVEHLSLYDIKTEQILEVFRKLCCSLKSLAITWDQSDGDIVSSQDMANIMVDFQNTLQELDITGTDEILKEVVKLDRMKLKKLTLQVEDNVNKQLLIELCRMQQSLEHLDIESVSSFDSFLDTKRFNELYQLLPNLKSVVLYPGLGTEPVDLTYLPSMTDLQKLDLHGDDCDGCSNCPDGCERAILNFRFSEHGYCNVTELFMSIIDLSEDRSEENFKRLLAKMPNLRTLDIMGSLIDTWPGLFRILKSLNCLKKLSLDVYPTDKTSCNIVDNLINLQSLCLWDDKTSSKLLTSILGRCPNLRELTLMVKKKAINKEVLRVICQKLTQLSDLKVTKGLLSKDDESYLRANCHSLKEVQTI